MGIDIGIKCKILLLYTVNWIEIIYKICAKAAWVFQIHSVWAAVFQTLTIIVHIEDIRDAFTCTQGYSQPWYLCPSHEYSRKVGHGLLAFSQVLYAF